MRAGLLGLDEPNTVTATGHQTWGGMPIELEMAELLYALVRYAKPDVVIESGTGSGRSTKAIAAGLVHNDKGHVFSYESQESFCFDAQQMFRESEWVTVIHGMSRLDVCGLVPDLVFIDAGYQREEEIEHWLTHPANPLVVVHDGNRQYESFKFGKGAVVYGHDGVWIGRGE